MQFNPTRLALARRRRGLSKRALAECAGMGDRTISAYEAGDRTPSNAALDSLSDALEFPTRFFTMGPFEKVGDEGEVSFRAVSKLTARLKGKGFAAAELALQLSSWLEKRFILPDVNIPDLRHHSGDPEAAADALRGYWRLGDKPIPHLLSLLERNGVRVFSLVEDSHELDAFSLWKGGIPFIFLNTVKSAERSRFDAAHELGHLVVHLHGAPNGRAAEQEADTFASAFLMPRTSVLAHAPRHPTIPSMIRAKRTWGVSLAALAHRLNRVGLLSDWRYRQVCIAINKEGYHRSEPEPMTREMSRALEKMFTELRNEGTPRDHIASELGWSANELGALVFQLVIACVDGNPNAQPAHHSSKPAPLRLV